MKIDHVQLAMPVGGEPKARAFYVDVLGMREVEKPDALRARGGCWFQLDGCHVHLGVDPQFVAATKAHPAFLVRNLDVLAARLEAAGSPVSWDAAVPGVDRLYSVDPFGNRIELIRFGHGFSDAASG